MEWVLLYNKIPLILNTGLSTAFNTVLWVCCWIRVCNAPHDQIIHYRAPCNEETLKAAIIHTRTHLKQELHWTQGDFKINKHMIALCSTAVWETFWFGAFWPIREIAADQWDPTKNCRLHILPVVSSPFSLGHH